MTDANTDRFIQTHLEELKLLAELARDRAYAPYSNFKVGAALLCRNGKIFTGCNVENATYGATVCAERHAIGNAIVAGEQAFVAIVVSTLAATPTPPCGICRQVLTEFNPDIVVLSFDRNGIQRRYVVRDLLPDAFTPEALHPEPESLQINEFGLDHNVDH